MEPAIPMPDTLLAADPAVAEPWTLREIRQQPETLKSTQALLMAARAKIEAFVAPLLARPEMRVVLTGAGTSAFIGEALAPWLSLRLDRTVDAVATTNIVSAPALYLRRDVPTLLVSFGRSGNSPESIAAIDVADAAISEVHHLLITCNGDGEMAKRQSANTLVVVLPEATHDRGFAMTSSFSAMMLSALSILGGIAAFDTHVPHIAAAVAEMLERAEPITKDLAGRGFERVVYLGSGIFQGLAREAALKLMELSDGRVVTAFDTAMGFRHGPKTIINDQTLVIAFLSNDPLTRRYDLDIVEELRSEGRCGAALVVSAGGQQDDAITVSGMQTADDCDLLFPFIIPAQLFGLRVSQMLGLTPDQPNASGTVSRVVQGVRIYASAA
jgi:tagatose-6-phosphate ketose/aldose isomerase